MGTYRKAPRGKCWACGNPVWWGEGVTIRDYGVIVGGKPMRRLAHNGECADKIRAHSSGERDR